MCRPSPAHRLYSRATWTKNGPGSPWHPRLSWLMSLPLVGSESESWREPLPTGRLNRLRADLAGFPGWREERRHLQVLSASPISLPLPLCSTPTPPWASPARIPLCVPQSQGDRTGRMRGHVHLRHQPAPFSSCDLQQATGLRDAGRVRGGAGLKGTPAPASPSPLCF